VANAGKSASWTPWKGRRLLSDVPGLTRTIDVLYDVSTAQRRKRLVSKVDPSELGQVGLGALVHISTSPLAVIERFSFKGDAGQQQRAESTRAVVAALADPDEWYRIGDANGSVKTTLGRLPLEDVARLVWHSYVLTWTSMWVVHGIGQPLDAGRLSFDRFRQLCRPTTGGS